MKSVKLVKLMKLEQNENKTYKMKRKCSLIWCNGGTFCCFVHKLCRCLFFGGVFINLEICVRV